MVSLSDIFSTLDKSIRVAFPHVKRTHLERIKKIETASMSIELVDYSSQVHNEKIFKKNILLDLVYLSKSNTVQEAIEVGDLLMNLFSLGLKVEDRFIHVEEGPKMHLVDQDLHMIINYMFYDEFKYLIINNSGGLSIVDSGGTSINNTEKDSNSTVVTDDNHIYSREDIKFMENLHLEYEFME